MSVVLAMAATACSGDRAGEKSAPDSGTDAPLVLATTGIWADIVSNVACEALADISTIIPVGGDPHGFEPSLQDRARMENADLVVANGLDLETVLEDTLGAVEDSGTPVFEFAEQFDPIPYAFESEQHSDDDEHANDDDEHDVDTHDDEHDKDGDDGRDHGRGGDPHVWFDPQRVSSTLPALAETLIAEVGLDADAVRACLVQYQAELAAVDAEVAALVEQLPAGSRKLVTNHDALGYFADRYGFKIIGTVIPAAGTMARTNPAQLEKLAEIIEHEGVKAIFAETLSSTEDADALASRVGDVEVVTLYTGSLGPTGSGAEDYIGFMRTNAELIVDALG